MRPENWQRIEAILQSTLERDPADRAAYLEQACGDDAELRAEVESLLSFDGDAGQLIAGAVQGSAAAAWARCASPSAMTRSSTSRLRSSW